VTARHAYTTAGTYLVRLTVTDSGGQSDTATSTVTDEPPVASFTIGTGAPEAGRAVPFDGSQSSDTDGSIVSYAWSFGDGAAAPGAYVSHTYQTANTYSVTLTSGTDSLAPGHTACHSRSRTSFGATATKVIAVWIRPTKYPPKPRRSRRSRRR
jgi:PKD repeat protein